MALNSIDGYIDFDFDDNAATGYPAATEEFGGVDAQMGVESYLSLRDDGNGHVFRRDGQALDWHEVKWSSRKRSSPSGWRGPTSGKPTAYFAYQF